jgi:hypothetical protein
MLRYQDKEYLFLFLQQTAKDQTAIAACETNVCSLLCVISAKYLSGKRRAIAEAVSAHIN